MVGLNHKKAQPCKKFKALFKANLTTTYLRVDINYLYNPRMIELNNDVRSMFLNRLDTVHWIVCRAFKK